MSGVPPAQDELGEHAGDHAGEPRLAAGLRGLRAVPQAAAPCLRAAEVERGARLPRGGRGALPQNGLANARFPLPVFCPLDSLQEASEGHLADLTYVRLRRDGRMALLNRLPYVGEGWYAKPAAAYMLEAGITTWGDFVWSLDATAHVEQRCLAWALEKMERAWDEEHMAKLAVNALIGLWARNVDIVSRCAPRTTSSTATAASTGRPSWTPRGITSSSASSSPMPPTGPPGTS